MANSALGLFGASASEQPAEPAKPERRVKLFPWDSLASQLFEPWGESSLDDLSLPQIYNAANKGNKKTRYHSHLCADLSTDAARRCRYLADMRDTSACNQELGKPGYGAPGKAGHLCQSQGGDRDIGTSPQDLARGEGSQESRDTGTLRQAKKQKVSTAVRTAPTQDEVGEAAKVFHKWLAQEQSAFRSALFIVAGKNTYYAAHAAEVMARATVFQKPLTPEHIVTAMTARISNMAPQSGSARGSSDATGLFEL